MTDPNSLTPHDFNNGISSQIAGIVAAASVQANILTIQGPQDYGLPQWTSATFYTATIREMDTLLSIYKSNPESVSRDDQMKLADFLVNKATDPRNSAFYFISEITIHPQRGWF